MCKKLCCMMLGRPAAARGRQPSVLQQIWLPVYAQHIRGIRQADAVLGAIYSHNRDIFVVVCYSTASTPRLARCPADIAEISSSGPFLWFSFPADPVGVTTCPTRGTSAGWTCHYDLE